jgi:hypothetical protein
VRVTLAFSNVVTLTDEDGRLLFAEPSFGLKHRAGREFRFAVRAVPE